MLSEVIPTPCILLVPLGTAQHSTRLSLSSHIVNRVKEMIKKNKQTNVKTLLLIPTLSSAITEHPSVLEKPGC